MAAFNAAVEACNAQKKKPGCHVPPQPTLDLTSSQGLYARLLKEYPQFRKTDAVLYLYGFSLRSEGKIDQALVQFKRILNEHPTSRFRPDAWMAVAEARFYEDSDYKGALAAYDEVLKFPDSPLYDLALFKTAWCYWKLGDSDCAARRFKEVLDLGSGVNAKSLARAHQLTESGRKRLEELKGEALEYLVQVFTEDERKGPKDAFDFLASIGGAMYSRKVIAKLADTFYAQARYDRAIESERFLIKLDPNDEGNPDRQKRMVEALRQMDRNKEAVNELRRPRRDLRAGQRLGQGAAEPADGRARAQARGRRCCARWPRGCTPTRSTTSSSRRGTSTSIATRARPTPTPITCRTSPAIKDAIEVHYLLGDIYFFKLKKYEEAGDQYLDGRQVEAGRQAAPRGAPAGDRRRTKNCGKRPLGARAARRSSCRRTSGWARRSISTPRCSRRIRRSPTSSTRTASSSTTTANTTRR